MRTFRLRSVGVAVALIAGVAGGAQIVGVQPALAQQPAFVITPTQTAVFEIKAGETVPLGKIFNVQAVVSGAQIIDVAVAGSEGVLINGVKALGKSSSTGANQHTWDEDAWAFHFPTLQEALSANVTAYQGAAIGLRIIARNALSSDVRTAFGEAGIRSVAAPVPAIKIVASASPPAVSAGEKVPLGKFLKTEVSFGPPKITTMAFQASGGVQLNGLSSGGLAPTLQALADASVTASSDGGLTVFILYTAVLPGGDPNLPSSFETQGSILVKFIAPGPAPAPPAPAPPAPAPAPPAPAPAPAPPTPAGGVPVVGGGNRPPVAQSTALIAVAGAVTPLTLQGSDPDGNALTFVVVQFPVHGKLSGQAPNLSYTPDRGFVGTDALIFTASDGTASSAQATVTITVTGKAVSIARTVSRAVRRTVKKTTKTR